MSAIRVWVETRWFEHFWCIHRGYARTLAMKNESDRAHRRANGLPPTTTRTTWSLTRELFTMWSRAAIERVRPIRGETTERK